MDENLRRDYEGENGIIIHNVKKAGKKWDKPHLFALLTIGIDGNLNSHHQAS